jgi:serine/threonine-protein kinase
MKSDRYQVLGPSADGGMARVFKARDTKLNRTVAIKQMSQELERDPAAVKAFEKEAAILGGLRDSNIVMVYDTIADEEGHHYLIMEYVEGSTLAEIIRAGPTDVPRALGILQQVLSGLQTMHKAGIVHHDLKPQNILVDAAGNAKIADFGLASAAGDDEPTLDWGSVQYMAPEVFDSNQADARIDIYALGMVAYELLLGQAAFRAQCREIYEGDSDPSKKWVNWQRDPSQQLKPLAEVDSTIPAHVSGIVARMLAKDRQIRYADVAAILKDLADKRQEQGDLGMEDSSATKPLGAFKETGRKQADAAAPPPVFVKKKSGNRLLYVGAGMFVLVACVILLVPSKTDQPGIGTIATTPGAELFVDGKSRGPLKTGSLTGQLPPGSHTIRLTMEGHEPGEQTLAIEAGRQWSVTLPLKEIAKPDPKAALPKPIENPARIDTPTGPMVLVPAGDFKYGNEGKTMPLPAYYIDEVEVTNASFKKFRDATGRPAPPAPNWDSDYLAKSDYPVVNVTYDEAVAFAEWAGKRLPTELEWEKAARGTDGRNYPWGSDFDPKRANLGTKEDRFQYAAPVGSLLDGRSPYGALDMAGNLWEWVSRPYGTRGLGADDRVLKGGSFLNADAESSTVYFHGARPGNERPNSVGFRCAKDAPTAAPAQAPAPGAAPGAGQPEPPKK